MPSDSVSEKINNEFDAIEELEKHAEKGVEKINRALDFEKIISNYHLAEYDRLFYDLFRKKCKSNILRFILRKDFTKRPNAEKFLIEQIKSERDPYMQGEILQLLGHMRSAYAATMAREYLKHEHTGHREVALFVLGWVGNESDISLLNKHLLSEQDPHLRITAASAHRQIAWRMPELKMDIIKSLKQGFEHEKDNEVIPWIIIMIETIMIKRLGIREDKQQPDEWHGDLEKAKKKTAQFLQSLDFEKK